MIVQWCCRGMDVSDAEALAILTGGGGIVCPPIHRCGPTAYLDALERLTETYLDLHVNHYDEREPGTQQWVCEQTPFISLSAGTVERDVQMQTNVVHPARRTALAFATDFGRRPGWVFLCYVIVGTGRATPIPAVCEEVRDLHHNRRYSAFLTEGEIAAKINVPSRQILAAERWSPLLELERGVVNARFVPPDGLLNQRGIL